MTKSEYLYGTDVELDDIPNEIIVRRIELLNDNLEELLEVQYLARDSERINKILKAISFWESINSK
jgi:hypothetical protein